MTFALFAYNQARYVRKAIEGALSQTYEPLEIILSDDCSTDDTFGIMEQMARDYGGPHRIVLNRNPSNAGVSRHLMKVAGMASGDVVVVAAGDDISHDDRVASLAAVFDANPGTFAVFSDVSVIDENGNETDGHSRKWDAAKPLDFRSLVRNGGGVGPGAAYAYRKQCFFWPWPLPSFVVSEDRILPLRAICLGTLVHLAEPLVSYREHAENATLRLAREKKLAKMNAGHMSEVRRTIYAALNEGKVGFRGLSRIQVQLWLVQLRHLKARLFG